MAVKLAMAIVTSASSLWQHPKDKQGTVTMCAFLSWNMGFNFLQGHI